MKVRFYYSVTGWHIRNAGAHKRWISAVLDEENGNTEEVSYIFTNDDEIRSINLEFLNHDYNTDVITFECGKEKRFSSEIYVSVETVRRNAKEYSVTFAEEIRRVLVHAILHLCGYDDSDETGIRKMRELEDKYLDCFRNELRI